MNAYFYVFTGQLVLDLQTRKVNKSAISSESFAVFLLEIHWVQSWNPSMPLEFQTALPPMPSEFQSKKPPFSLGIPRCRLWYGIDIFWNHPFSINLWLANLPLSINVQTTLLVSMCHIPNVTLLLGTHSAAPRESTTFWPLWWRIWLSIRVQTTLNHIRFVK